MSDTTLSRLKQYLDYKGITNRAFEMQFGFSNGSFASQLKKGRTIGVDRLENILHEYKDINIDWLFTGSGPMLRRSEPSRSVSYAHGGEDLSMAVSEDAPQYRVSHVYEPAAQPEGIPLLPISAMAGAFTGDMTVLEYECERYVIPAFRGADFLIPVKGSSMYPKYSSGDLVACKRIPMTDLFFQWNKVYVLDTDQGALIKRICPGSSDDTVLIVSDNKDYTPFELHRSAIRAVALVVGVVRLE